MVNNARYVVIKVYKNLLSTSEVAYLNKTALKYFEDGKLKQYGYKGRYTTRCMPNEFSFEPLVYDISAKIRKAVGVDGYPLETDRGKDGINATVTLNGGYIGIHTDPRGPEGQITYRCNVITQKSSCGGELIVDNEIVPLEVGDVHCYAVSEIEHIVTATEGDIPRVLWMFGCYMPAVD